jgi:predicted nucleic acid-binding protein
VFDLRDIVSAYDATYVTLAEALQCRLITRDAKLARTTGQGAQIEIR